MRRRPHEIGIEQIEDDGDVLIFGPKTGLDYVSGMSGMSLGTAQFKEIFDLRTADGTATIRPGTSLISTINTSATFKGIYTCRFGTTEYIFVAYKSGSNVLVKISTDGGANWSQITESSGAFGDTRMVDTGQLVQFQHVKDKFVGVNSAAMRQDCVVIVNGSDTPRVYSDFYGGAGGSGQKLCAISDIAYPADIPAVKANLFGSLTGFAFTSIAGYASLDGDFDFATSGASGNARPRLTIDATVDNADWAFMELTSGVQLLGGKMLYIGIETALPNFLENVKIEVGAGTFGTSTFTSAATIWDPANPTQVTGEPLDLSNKTLYGFDVERFNTATTYDSIKLTGVGNVAPAAAVTADIFLVRPGVAPAAALPGGTLWAFALSNAGSHTNSPGYKPPVEHSKTLDATYAADDYKNLPQPVSEGFYYGYTGLLKNPSTTDRDKGIEGYDVWRKKPSDSRYWLTEHFESCTWGGASWGYTNGTAAGDYQGVTFLSTDVSYDSQPPTGRHKAMPAAKAIGAGNDRVFVGAVSATKPALYVSGAGQPFRFADTPLFDGGGNFLQDQPGTHSLEGDTVRRILSITSSALGIATIVVLGERSVYFTGGVLTSQILQLSDMGVPGTISPMSAVVARGALFWLDKEKQLRRWAGGPFDPVSLFKVDDQTRAIPGARLEYVWGAYFEDRYFLAHSAADTTVNGRALVWNGFQHRFEATDRRSFAGMEGMVSFLDTTNGVQKLFYAGVNSSDLKLYRMEGTDTQDIASDITVGLKTGDIYFDRFDGFTWTEHYAMADDINSGSMTVTETYQPGAVAETTSISLDVSSGRVWKHSLTKSNNGEGIGISCPVTYTWSGTAGKKVYAIAAKVSPREAMASA